MSYHTRLMWVGLGALLAGAGQAQVTLDGTLGRAGPLPGPDYQITADLGRQVGGNLFHSFGQFSIHTGESATFSGPNSVHNIIGRVTGGETSLIDGTLRSTIPGANLYLLNPAGVLFGEHAQLDVPGSVHVSTADVLRLTDGGRFDARTRRTAC
jgi:filamentous hemagglutinin family protein